MFTITGFTAHQELFELAADTLDDLTTALVRASYDTSADLSADFWPELYWADPDSIDLDDDEQAPDRREATIERIIALASRVYDGPERLVHVEKRERPQPAELRQMRAAMGASQTDMAVLMDVNQSTWKRWESGQSRIPTGAVLEIDELGRRFEREIEALRSDDIDEPTPEWEHAARYWASR